LKLECNISISTNFLASGILDVSSQDPWEEAMLTMQSLDQQIEKNSQTLGRMATYNSYVVDAPPVRG